MSDRSSIVIGSDVTEEHSGVVLVDKFLTAPHATSHDYLHWIEKQLALYKIDFFIPVNELELESLARLSQVELIRLLGSANIIWPGQKAILKFCDKEMTFDFLERIKIPAPRQFSDKNLVQSSDFPVVLKPRKGAGSKNIFVCQNDSELDAASKFVEEYVIQEYIGDSSNEFTASVFRTKLGEKKVIVFRRNLIGGATGWAKVVEAPAIVEICESVADSVELVGSINIQLRIQENSPKVFEVNGRFSSTVLMRHLLGFQDFIWTLGNLDSLQNYDALALVGKVVSKSSNFKVWET
jgi:carbamoyl-phosphate synthase large subunit